jgi:hypothetical protein
MRTPERSMVSAPDPLPDYHNPRKQLLPVIFRELKPSTCFTSGQVTYPTQQQRVGHVQDTANLHNTTGLLGEAANCQPHCPCLGHGTL